MKRKKKRFADVGPTENDRLNFLPCCWYASVLKTVLNGKVEELLTFFT